MLSVAGVRSASGAANYFAKDDYYTVEGSSEISAWGGEGAEAIGLSGEVSKDAFEGVLNGILPSGEAVAQVENRRAGYDLTFSMPKSASVMAYVAGDKRVLDANMAAVKATMAWVEKNLAEGRRDIEGRKVPVQTGNLVYALFQHDTSRALDPQAHIHAVIANLTRMPDGKWQALHADKLWSHNSIIGSIYHAFLRAGLERIGYQVDLKGKHGTFEIAGVPKAVIGEFSQRREEILDHATRLGIKSPEGLREITKRSRDPKLDVEDRAALKQGWIDQAAAHGFDGKDLRAAAEARAGMASSENALERGYRAIVDAVTGARQTLGALLRPQDPLVDNALARAVKSPAEARAQLAVASAVRILSEREAAWPVNLLGKTALDLGLKGVTVDLIERRIDRLVQNRQLIPGVATAADRTGRMVTTQEALRTEEKILAAVEEGKGKSEPIVAAADAPQRLQDAAERPLNPGQLAAATMILSSADRTVSVQGAAGTGKSTMLQAVARVAEEEGARITGLAFQNKMVADLAEGAGIKAQTIASFVLANERFVTERDTLGYEAAREKLAGTMLLVDETSMVSSNEMLKLHQITAALGVDKLVLVGDRQQLSSIDAGKAFAMIQAGGGTMARMDQNIRQRTDQLRTVAALANIGKAGAALKVLGDRVVEAGEPAAAAADMWLELSPGEREATAVFASGRDARAVINQRIQDGLIAEGSVKGQAIHLTVFERVNTTREELRYASTYRQGQTLEVGRGGAQDVGIKAGRYDVLKVHANGKVELSDGRRRIRFDPQKLSPTEQRDRLQLSEKKDLQLREGDRIRWTANDKQRGLHNAALARVVGVDADGVKVETADKVLLTLSLGDPMLSRLDLAYSLNMHMAQGITTDKAITVMSSHERNLSNQRLFNVGVTRVRDELTMVVDDKEKLARQLDMNPGNKTSSLETLGRLDIDGRKGPGAQPREKFDPGPIDGVNLSDLAPVPSDLPPLPDGAASAPAAKAPQAPPDLKPDRGDPLPPLPERSLGLDL
ncbi:MULTISPECIES: MobF family relaxase [Sphingomonadales]|jgi:conjugative relaxase-like TrwC/TraI family protein|uniref:Conjugative relaxase n=8 Tax=root TaxID=1 RepID=A0A249MZF6_SPHXE|nr:MULTISPECIES: MobF family relaxase [Sphingomonadaceae]ABQ71270.1 Conjugative relaxase region-like protein [Rhizorhabdus wittichii RW1]TNE45852.1 MAG: conjugative relaxase [Sphingomonadales bacterium]ASY46763.1 conjugative relaxase [Sphingobium xenophagum]MBB3928039.1 conjugative relaxase-like TrwC/TraI family protein [Sphingobium jiangsuense]MBP8231076.1 conjugative relaxase [Rhizorhabdus sp.]|tara:strand:+ start:6289 stop:9333 length:3045 start_codon:yes stop_codon:yes gene_type:complete